MNVGAHSAIKDGQTLLQLVLFRLDPGAAKIALSFSWSDQRSSSDIDSSSSFFDNILMPCRTNSGFNIAAPTNNQEGYQLLPTKTKVVFKLATRAATSTSCPKRALQARERLHLEGGWPVTQLAA